MDTIILREAELFADVITKLAAGWTPLDDTLLGHIDVKDKGIRLCQAISQTGLKIRTEIYGGQLFGRLIASELPRDLQEELRAGAKELPQNPVQENSGGDAC